MIDLHAHTTESDGTLSPVDLATLAHTSGLEALAITDHDTLAGFDSALPIAVDFGLHLVCGIELSTRYRDHSVHLLGYFLYAAPQEDFRQWIAGLQLNRYLRNQKLAEKLQGMGFAITLEEIRRRGGNLPGRPHIAALMVEKGYVNSTQQAFDQYLDELGSCYVCRDEPPLDEAIARISAAGGFSSLPHPGRISRDPTTMQGYLRNMRDMGLSAIEAYHSDHSPAEVSLYVAWAAQFSLAITGGSDFHGDAKPNIALGTGRNGNLRIPASVLLDLHNRFAVHDRNSRDSIRD